MSDTSAMQANAQTYSALIAEDKAVRAHKSSNRNARARSAQQNALIGRMLSGYARLAIAGGLAGVLLSVVWGLS